MGKKNEKLIAARLAKYWTQEDACEKLEVPNVRTWQRWESGDVVPTLYFRKRLCEAFNTSLEDLGFFSHTTIANETDEKRTLDDNVVTLTPEQIALVMELLNLEEYNMENLDQSKRETLATILRIAGVAATAFSLDSEPFERLATGKATNIDEATLTHFEGLMQTCWKLSNTSELPLAEKLIPQFLPRLEELAPYQPKIAALASQGLQLHSILVAHRLKLINKVAMCEKAVQHAKLGNHIDTIVAALIQLGVAYQYAQQPEKALNAYQEALNYSEQTSPLLRARVYAESAEAYAHYQRKREAEFYLSLAYETFPEHPESDASYLFADCGKHTLALYDGLVKLDLQQSSNAWATFHAFTSQTNNSTPERIRLEIVNHQGRAAALDGNLEAYASSLEDGLSGSIAIKSHKRYNEAITIYQTIPTSWKSHSLISPLIKQFRLA